MKKLAHALVNTLFVTALSASAFAQAPIERQPPQPLPDQQQAQPNQQDEQAYPQQYDPQQGDPQYQQQAGPPDQQQQGPPPTIAPQQLDQLVQRIALYPDPLLAQVLTASTFWNEIPDAATWAQQHNFMTGDSLAQAIQADNLPWDPSVLALLPFPNVLDMMGSRPPVDRHPRQRRPRPAPRRHGRRPTPAPPSSRLRLPRPQRLRQRRRQRRLP
ncbi:DUF3300 domain-containing protein [Tunturiibacter empetritectus]|uniref:DUF3300 domain-containing protein n=1 Tax=Tunturiibacter empetritectus TaxID=3069691 RepID=UPI003D9B2856